LLNKLVLIVAGVTGFLLPLTINYGYAASTPVVTDAACDALRLRWQTKSQGKASLREKNFYLFDAADLGCSEMVTLFLSEGAVVDARDRAGNTGFMLAARKGHRDSMELLLSAGADPKQTNLLGTTALLMAASNNRRRVTKRLLELGLDPNRANSKGVTPLLAATFNGNTRLVLLLLQSGADLRVTDASGKGALVYASGKGFHKIVRILFESSTLEINQRYGNDLTALMWAAGFSNDVPVKDGVMTVEYLLAQGADPDLVDNRGRTALHVAAQRGHTEVVALLLENGADPTIADQAGLLARDVATSESVKLLLGN